MLGLGTMGLGGRYDRDQSRDNEHIALIRDAVALGVTLFDTAEVYGDGHGEELLGRAVAGVRDQVVISTKFSSGNSAYESVVASAEASLRRLGTSWIDIYQAHWPNPSVPQEETVRALERLWREGKIRHVGMSNTTATEARRLLSMIPDGLPVVTMQQDYSLAERFVEHRLLPLCMELGVALTAYSPIAQGRLAKPGDDVAGALISELAARNGLTPAQLALAWVARQDSVVPLPMTSQRDHLQANVAAVTAPVPEEDFARLSRAFAQPIKEVATDAIDVVASHTGKAYRTLSDAIANSLDLSPSPVALAEELKDGDMLKPVKLRLCRNSDRYELFEGQLRYWAWVIAHDGKKPILASIHGETAS